ncbi:ABC transporter substrate-binding protein [Acidobacterium capsulatum]|uniref:ABC transporter, peptide/opine/nickel uptake transporter (PepT) family, periplasmic substrate-binding protein n=2 Tax=Acidobacterium TaxID=33973 RepID=C1F259_ACIC5|nr:ABC transporter substrate-binding protein [Acidobacterium capsulatum]ACO31773.1 ABC transporter, peptide/opine/nickel uptake transporter (PepT) family, periplasmic substrate-binding protein [Acidobacterium capsulatum ATCC 51196]
MGEEVACHPTQAIPPLKPKAGLNGAPTVFVVLAVLMLALSGCGGQKPPANTVVMVIESSPTNLDPRVGLDAQSEHIDQLLFDALVQHNNHFGFAPDLAVSWQTPDPLTYIFHLRRDVRFSNGQPLTSRDVKWTFTSMMDGTVITVKAGSYEDVRSIDTPDAWTVVFHLKRPDNSFIENLADGAIGIVPYGSGRNFGQHPVGTGPFEFVSQRFDRDVVIERAPHSWHAEPKIRRVRFDVVPDATTRALELEKGAADVELNSLPADTVTALMQNPNLVVEAEPGTNLNYVVFNTRDAILRHVRVRQAIAAAVNRKLIVQSLFRGRARLAESLLPPEHWAWTRTPPHDYDPALANRLLDEAGYPRGRDGIRFHLSLKTSTDETTRLIALAMQDELAQVGIALDVRSFEFATFYADLTHGAFQLAISRWIGGNEQPDIFRYTYAASAVPPYGANRGFYNNPDVNQWITDAQTAPTLAEEKQDYAKIQQTVARELPTLDLWYLDTVLVHTRRLKHVRIVPFPSGNFYFLETVELRQPRS